MKLSYRFSNPDLLDEALTHPSCAKQVKGRPFNNQRLEFLGDAILGAVIAKLLFDLYPGEQEGDLARRFAALVCGEQLVEIAKQIDLPGAIRLASSEEEAGGRANPSNIEDVCEALIGALYLDGGMEAAEPFILEHWRTLAESVSEPPKDPKTGLQEWAQGRGLPLPHYAVIEETGPAHAPHFTIEVRVEGHPPASAKAGSKKAAEREAAATLWERLLRG